MQQPGKAETVAGMSTMCECNSSRIYSVMLTGCHSGEGELTMSAQGLMDSEARLSGDTVRLM